MNFVCRLLLAAALLSALTVTSSARLMRLWPKQELLDKSDVVAIGTPVSSTDTNEPVALPDTPQARASGVNTKFKVSMVIKGTEDLAEFTLRHARLADPPGITINGPNLASFDGGKKQSFLLYLIREKDGRYAPVSGQTDPAFQAIVPAKAAPPLETVATLPTPGPENGGLRMRMTIAPDTTAAWRVQLDVINVSDKPVTLRGGWEQDEETGGIKDYLEAATSIETLPAIEPWSGQVKVGGRTQPQPEQILKAGETLTVSWKTSGKSLKNRVSDPLSVQNPEFPVPGLYSIHAALAVPTAAETILLRSNEQLFSARGSSSLPKSTFGHLVSVEAASKTATLNLGSLQKVRKGDQFRIRTGYSEYYRLSITNITPVWSAGTLVPEPLPRDFSSAVPFPSVGQGAVYTREPLVPDPARPVEMEKDRAAKVPVVLRVQFVSENGSDKYGWSKVRLVAALKNETKHTFPQEFEVAHLSTEPGVPAGLCTVYLERYNEAGDDLWKLMGGSGTAGVSHHSKP